MKPPYVIEPGKGDWPEGQTCCQCDKEAKQFIVLGEPLDYDTGTAILCFPCFKKAITIFQKAEGNAKSKPKKV